MAGNSIGGLSIPFIQASPGESPQGPRRDRYSMDVPILGSRVEKDAALVYDDLIRMQRLPDAQGSRHRTTRAGCCIAFQGGFESWLWCHGEIVFVGHLDMGAKKRADVRMPAAHPVASASEAIYCIDHPTLGG